MAFDIKQILLNALTAVAEQTEEVSLEAGLQSLHDKDVAIWTEACAAGLLFAEKIGATVKGKFVEALVEGLTTAIQESQSANPVAAPSA